MKLQRKTFLYVTGVFLVAGLVMVAIFNEIFMDQFRAIERQLLERNVQRIEEGIQQEVRNLITRTMDWGLWDESYEFVVNPDSERLKQTGFVDANLSFEALESLGYSHVIYLNRSFGLVKGVQIDNENQSVLDVDQSIVARIVSSELLKDILSGPDAATGGFLRLNDKLFLLAASPIMDSAVKEEPRGSIVIMREFSKEMFEGIASVIKIKLGEQEITPTEQLARGVGPSFIDAFSKARVEMLANTIKTEMMIRDINSNDALLVSASFDRDVFHQGLKTERFLLVVILVAFLLSASAIMFLLRLSVLVPLYRLGTSLEMITSSKNFSGRVAVESSDELGQLSRQVNQTLQALQTAMSAEAQSRELAEKANAAKSSFIAKVSHELRTPIHSITGMLRILLKQERSNAKRNYIMMARNAAYGLLETINEILDFSKAEAGRLAIERLEVSLHEVVRDSLRLVGPRVEEKGSVEVVASIEQGLPDRVIGDPTRLKQIFVNLLGNAVKFTKSGHIGMDVRKVDETEAGCTIRFTISDTGVGIPEDRIDHIFEPFSQADDSVNRLFTGTGLGLTIVRQFVEIMEGSVEVESKLGIGSSFIITIPFKYATDWQPNFAQPTLKNKTVALIDGVSVAFDQFSAQLQRTGFTPKRIAAKEFRTVRDLQGEVGDAGLILVSSEAFKSSIVFDCVVELSANPKVPVVALLSPFEITVRERLLALNISYALMRPISLFDIMATIGGDLAIDVEQWEDGAETSLQASKSLNILVADDAQTNRVILTEMLRDVGHNVVCVENGVDMVARVKSGLVDNIKFDMFDIVLTDVQMPLLDGLNATSQIRDLESRLAVRERVPIVAVTAHALTEETSRMRQYGVDDVVTKPIDPTQLGRVISRLTNSAVEASLQQAEESNILLLVDMFKRYVSNTAKHSEDIRNAFGLSEQDDIEEHASQMLNIEDVYARCGDSLRRVALVYSGFLGDFKDMLRGLRADIREGDSKRLAARAHAIKGLLLDVGAEKVAAEAAELEKRCGEKGYSEVERGRATRIGSQLLVTARLIGFVFDKITRDFGVKAPSIENVCSEGEVFAVD